jgi:hypothetical protein
MKNKVFLSALLAMGLSATVNQAAAQSSISYFYNENHHARCMASLPGNGEFVSAETIKGAADEAIHISHYDAVGSLLNSFLLDRPIINDQATAVIAMSSQKFVVLSNFNDANNAITYTRLTMMDVAGTVLQDRIIASTHPSFNSLYGLDLKWDSNLQQYIVCGTAFKADQDKPTDAKDAFVVTLDPAFLPIKMRFYTSNSGNNSNDYDIANRVVLNNTGNYYITGSENVYKPIGSGYYVMGIRNMLIDPFALDFSTGWSVPLALKTGNDELSVDMSEDLNTGQFVTLVNYIESPANWGVIRIDPSNGTSIFNTIETSKEYEFAHNISSGNNPNELVVTGMMYRNYTGNCGLYDQQADPFHMILDMNPYPAGGLLKSEYITAVGNVNGTIDYWNYGGIYATQGSGYPLAPYMNRFADREAPGKNYGIITPIFAPTNTELNTKFLDTDDKGNNYCKTLNCTYDLQNWLPTLYPITQLSDKDYFPKERKLSSQTTPYGPYDKKDCPNDGYFKTVQHATAAAGILADVKVYPNPVASEVKIELPAEMTGHVAISLMDMSGKLVAPIYEGAGTQAINYQLGDNVASGAYFIQVVADGKTTHQQKITVIR